MPPHYLNEEQSSMRLSRITNLIDCLCGGVDRRVVTDCKVGTCKIVIDRARRPNDANPMLSPQRMRAMKRAITTAGNNAIDAVCSELFGRHDASVGLKEVGAARCLQDRTTTIDRVGRPCAIQNFKVTRDHPGVPADDADHFETTLVGRTLNRPNMSVHPGGIATACKHSNAFHSVRKYVPIGLSMKDYSLFLMLWKRNESVMLLHHRFAAVTLS